jgi:hypothetical protein
MCENGKKEGRPLPPVIAELLRQKGWSWPLSEADKRQIHEALNHFSGATHVPEELWDEVFEGVRGFEHVRDHRLHYPSSALVHGLGGTRERGTWNVLRAYPKSRQPVILSAAKNLAVTTPA